MDPFGASAALHRLAPPGHISSTHRAGKDGARVGMNITAQGDDLAIFISKLANCEPPISSVEINHIGGLHPIDSGKHSNKNLFFDFTKSRSETNYSSLKCN